MKQAQGPTRTALHNRLSAALEIPVYSVIEEDASYPHCQIGTIIPMTWGGKSRPGQKLTCLIDFWDDCTQTQVDIDNYVNAASEAITDVDSSVHNPLAIPGFEVVNQLVTVGADLPNIDNTIGHKQITIEVWVQEVL